MKIAALLVMMVFGLAASISSQPSFAMFIEDDIEAGDRVGQGVTYAIRQVVRNTPFYSIADCHSAPSTRCR
jgi:hypothetical protein